MTIGPCFVHLGLGAVCGCAGLEDQMVAKAVSGRLDFIDVHACLFGDCALDV